MYLQSKYLTGYIKRFSGDIAYIASSAGLSCRFYQNVIRLNLKTIRHLKLYKKPLQANFSNTSL